MLDGINIHAVLLDKNALFTLMSNTHQQHGGCSFTVNTATRPQEVNNPDDPDTGC